MSARNVDLDKFRLRRFAEKLIAIGEMEVYEAPVHEVVLRGDDIDLVKLPFHLQHELDGAPYISSGIDYTVDPANGRRNVGCRRLMFRDRRTMRANLSQPSDLKKCYIACVERGETLPTSFAIGSHPLDYLAAGLRLPDDEMIIEGYFDELGYREQEGPYGEFYGFYGPEHMDPVFHVTAICMRKDMLHQTVFHSGGHLGWTESGNLGGLNA